MRSGSTVPEVARILAGIGVDNDRRGSQLGVERGDEAGDVLPAVESDEAARDRDVDPSGTRSRRRSRRCRGPSRCAVAKTSRHPQPTRSGGVFTYKHVSGGDRDSTHSADVDYAQLLPSLFELRVGNFYIQLASKRDRFRAAYDRPRTEW